MFKLFFCGRLNFSSLLSILFIFAIFILVNLTACSGIFRQGENSQTTESPSNTTSKSENKSQTAPPASENDTRAGMCENPYYPILTGGREYRPAGKTDAGSYVLTQSIKADDSFTETRVFSSGIKLVNNWVCTPEGLRNVQYNNMLRTSNAAMNLETVSSTGVTLPKNDWKVGKKWMTEYVVKADFQAGPIKRKVDGRVEISNEIVAIDQNISVPGGTFAAALVASEIVLNLQMGGQKLPSPKVKLSAWYSPEVGLVKQEADTSFGKETFEFAGNK